jgi:3'-phosphoadenosine 5'-phosphosulfate sulfotransferase (PAPS reductase)/FAD synthetase
LKRVPNLAAVASRDIKDKEYSDGRWANETAARAIWPNCAWLTTESPACDVNYGRTEAGAFLGLRADESAIRRMNLRMRGTLCELRNGLWHCCPVANWAVLDIWAYILSRKIDYNRAYDRMESLGIDLDRQRIAEFSIERVTQYGTLAILKRGWPGLWNEYAGAHPEARNYA